MKKIWLLLPVMALFVAFTVQAHVTVKPSSAGVASFQTFTLSVPSEKEIATVNIRLLVPEGLQNVTPTVKSGWTIRLVEDHDIVKEIVWSNGSIPGEYRDEFSFSAKVPATETTLFWKAYQTYKDGSVVAWELTPDRSQPKKADGAPDFSQFGPASQTKIINDLQASSQTPKTDCAQTDCVKPTNKNDGTAFGVVAIIISLISLYFAKVRK
jgi:uncharacterized protein YcnI